MVTEKTLQLFKLFNFRTYTDVKICSKTLI